MGRAAYDAYAEGIYTYCLGTLRDHAAAASALRGTFVLADRHIGRLPDLGMLKPWLYALARYECLVRLDGRPPLAAVAAEAAADGRGRSAGGSGGTIGGGPAPRSAEQRAELAALAWPEAIGLAPAEREALELAIRHGLEPSGLAAVLGWEEDTARGVLLGAGREVDRTRAALEGARGAVSCPDGPGLAAAYTEPGVRDQLVDHVDECRRCGPHVRLAAARLAPTAGAAAATSVLPSIAPPHDLRADVLGDLGRGRSAQRPAELSRRATEFDADGFPVFRVGASRVRSGRRRMALVAVVVVAIVAAIPATVLWQAAHRHDVHDAAHDARISAARVTTADDFPEERDAAAGRKLLPGTSAAPRPAGSAAASATAPPGVRSAGPQAAPVPVGIDPAAPLPVVPAAPAGTPYEPAAAPVPPAVDVAHDRSRTVITLRNTGTVPVDWTADTTAGWLRLEPHVRARSRRARRTP
ncbi:RNA polymerase sigma factor [Yinghuangia aomiensis]